MRNEVEIVGNTALIHIRRKDGTIVTTVVDKADLPLVSSIAGAWRVTRRPGWSFYVITGRRPLLHLHRLVTSAPEGLDVDHINHDTLDNRRANLRIVSRSCNLLNRKGANRNNNTTGIRGVSFESRKKQKPWRVRIVIGGSTVFQGYFSDREAARAAAESVYASLSG